MHIKIRYQSRHLFQSLSVIGHSLHICYSALTQTAKQGGMLPPCLPVINPHDIFQKWVVKRGNLAHKDAVQKREREKKEKR
jgi:hypothetical protein